MHAQYSYSTVIVQPTVLPFSVGRKTLNLVAAFTNYTNYTEAQKQASLSPAISPDHE